MWTAYDVTQRLRREVDERLVVKLMEQLRPGDPIFPGRFVVCMRLKRMTGRRTWPVTICGDGSVFHGGATTLREVSLDDEIVYVHEDAEGRFLPLEPNVIRRELWERDSHAHDLAREAHEKIQAKREAQKRDADDDVRQRTKYYRRAFARVADGLDSGVTR